jgi:hypothetical protein
LLGGCRPVWLSANLRSAYISSYERAKASEVGCDQEISRKTIITEIRTRIHGSVEVEP